MAVMRSADGVGAVFGDSVAGGGPGAAFGDRRVYNPCRVSREVRVLSNAGAGSFDCHAKRRAQGVLRTWAMHARDSVRRALPQRCELCVECTDGSLLCAACAAGLPRVASACPVCALPSHDGATCGACLRDPPPYAATVAALVYAFPTDRLLQRIKYAGRIALADWAGAALAEAACAALAERAVAERPDRIVPLPLSEPRQRERGFNQAREIALRAARATSLPLDGPLVRTSGGPPQAALPWAERRGNVRGAFALRAGVRGARIALVDDVMTTGATLAEAASTLVAAGAERVECWVVARTLPPGG
jgi:ComF family protein